MRLTPNTPIFGVKPEILRDCADQLRGLDSFSIDGFCKAIGAPAEEAKPVLEHLLCEGFISMDGADRYLPTGRFLQLAIANISHGLSRPEASTLLQRVIERARDINAKPEEFDHHISRLAVFGSYLDGDEVLGDLDIAFDCQRNPISDGIPAKRWSLRKSIENFSKMLSYLRLRKPCKISLHTWDEIKSLKTPYKVVFEYESRNNQK